jgi:hypothetical protein
LPNVLGAQADLAVHAVQYPWGDISVSPAISLHPPGPDAVLPGMKCAHRAQSLSSLGVFWYFNALRIAALVAADDGTETTSKGRRTPPMVMNWRLVDKSECSM